MLVCGLVCGFELVRVRAAVSLGRMLLNGRLRNDLTTVHASRAYGRMAQAFGQQIRERR